MLYRLFVVLLLAAAGSAVPSAAQAAACSGTSGVTVVVQFPDHTEIGCAAGDPSSGYQALRSAGFEITMATGNGTGAICSIDQYPDHACPSMPSADAYWAYFHGKPGGSWAYSSTGGGGYNPKPGTVEGWRFGGGAAPSTPPPGSTSTPKPSPTATATPTRQPTARPTSVASAKPGQGSASVQAPGGTPTAPDATSSAPDATRSPTTGPTATATDVSGRAVAGSATDESIDRSAEAKDDASGGSSWIWGLVLIALVGAAATVVAVRRQRS